MSSPGGRLQDLWLSKLNYNLTLSHIICSFAFRKEKKTILIVVIERVVKIPIRVLYHTQIIFLTSKVCDISHGFEATENVSDIILSFETVEKMCDVWRF